MATRLIDRVLEYTSGNMTQLAKELDCSRSLINSWLKQGYIPEAYALKVEILTGGDIDIREVLEEAERYKGCLDDVEL